MTNFDLYLLDMVRELAADDWNGDLEGAICDVAQGWYLSAEDAFPASQDEAIAHVRSIVTQAGLI